MRMTFQHGQISDYIQYILNNVCSLLISLYIFVYNISSSLRSIYLSIFLTLTFPFSSLYTLTLLVRTTLFTGWATRTLYRRGYCARLVPTPFRLWGAPLVASLSSS